MFSLAEGVSSPTRFMLPVLLIISIAPAVPLPAPASRIRDAISFSIVMLPFA